MKTLLSIVLVFVFIIQSGLALDIRGRLDLTIRNVTQFDLTRTHFSLHRIFKNEDSNSRDDSYSASTKLRNVEGDFLFQDVPVNRNVNETTYFTLHSHSQDFNLKPNRILIEVTGNGPDEEASVKAYENMFGREYFPSPDILYPETLKGIATEPFIRITLMNKQPFREYVMIRNPGLFKSGPIANILNSKYKMAGVITVVFMIVFPMILEKLDPETAKAIKEEKLKREREKYVSK